ncbi:hypothetical protein GCM10011335_40070 [Aureimonas glaciei]|uniref:Uncharacterized protein n=1 Tax=Aureimonas glaciei TaxID=1776957 RepID=A0A916Y6Z2_9HYPH|nr:hypothetical protein GCM10011335_40070 [Aureimonas glaciei]
MKSRSSQGPITRCSAGSTFVFVDGFGVVSAMPDVSLGGAATFPVPALGCQSTTTGGRVAGSLAFPPRPAGVSGAFKSPGRPAARVAGLEAAAGPVYPQNSTRTRRDRRGSKGIA